jgi:hypothetical protein
MNYRLLKFEINYLIKDYTKIRDIQALEVNRRDTQTHRKYSDLISLLLFLFFFQNKEFRLKMEE